MAADGLAANVAYFKLGFLDKTSVALGQQFQKMLPALWMKAGAKGACPDFGGEYDKLKWMAKKYRDEYGKEQAGMEFDLLIVDEAQEGVDTDKTDRAFRNIGRKHTLYLSGTPFKQLASEQFSKEQIFNWSYADEQEAKANWSGEDANPYETLPRLAMFTYQLSGMIREQIEKGLDLSGEDGTVDYAFDLTSFSLRTSGEILPTRKRSRSSSTP